MHRFTSRATRLGLATALAAGLTVLGAGTASADTCNYDRNSDAVLELGSSHFGPAGGEGDWLEPGMGLEGQRGKPNSISLGQIPLPDGGWLIGLIDDPTGLYPVTENFYR